MKNWKKTRPSSSIPSTRRKSTALVIKQTLFCKKKNKIGLEDLFVERLYALKEG